MKTKHPVMVFREVTSDSDVMSPFILLNGLTLNTETYIKCLTEVMLIYVERVAAGRPYACQHESAPNHASRRTQSWRWKKFMRLHHPSYLVTPNSNPFDYYVWVAVEWETNKTPCKDELKARIIAAFTNLNKENRRKDDSEVVCRP